jgi:hypothetical protein
MSEARKQVIDYDPIAEKREERALRNFKQVLREMLYLLMQSTRSETASLQWVNTQRNQFVLETSCSRHRDVTFQDRVGFESSYLDPYKSLDEPVQLEVGIHVDPAALPHYYRTMPVRFVNIIPFINNGETVALTVLESADPDVRPEDEAAVVSYNNALANLLYTFLELNDLSRNEAEWEEYETTLDLLNDRDEFAVMMDNVVTQLQSYLSRGGVTMLCRAAGGWRVALNSAYANAAPRIGSVLQENTLVYSALKSGKPEFAIHFNGSPRRVNTDEPLCQGASYAIPMLLFDRRQAVFVVYDENPLIFKESVKHKLTNLVRIAALKMMSSPEAGKISEDLIAGSTGAFHASITDRILTRQLHRCNLFPDEYTWVVMFSSDEITSLRTRHGVETLKNLRRQIVMATMREMPGVSSVVGFHADYIFTAIVCASDENGLHKWLTYLQALKQTSFDCGDQGVYLNFQAGAVKLSDRYQDGYPLMRELKKAFSESCKTNNFVIAE